VTAQNISDDRPKRESMSIDEATYGTIKDEIVTK
jgi:hypothetical protein